MFQYLFRSFLPLENPLGFGFQNFLEFGFATILLSVSALALLWRKPAWLQSPFVALVIAMAVAQPVLTGWTRFVIRPKNLPMKAAPVRPPAAQPEPSQPKPIAPKLIEHKQVSPFEEVK